MKYIFPICIIVILACVPIQAKKRSRLEKKVEFNEDKLHELYEDMQILRERIDILEEQVDGLHKLNTNSP